MCSVMFDLPSSNAGKVYQLNDTWLVSVDGGRLVGAYLCP
jgi:hypothetical protein